MVVVYHLQKASLNSSRKSVWKVNGDLFKQQGMEPYKTILSNTPTPPPPPRLPALKPPRPYPFTQNDGHFSVILHEENYATNPLSNMAAVAGRSLVGRLALVTGKLLFCDANKVSLRINKWRERCLRSPSSFFLHRGNFYGLHSHRAIVF